MSDEYVINMWRENHAQTRFLLDMAFRHIDTAMIRLWEEPVCRIEFISTKV